MEDKNTKTNNYIYETKNETDDKFSAFKHTNVPDDKDNGSHKSTKINTIRHAWDDLVSKTTLHGMCHVQDKDKTMATRVIWSVLTLGMLSVTVYVLVTLLLSYRDYPIKSVWNFKRETYIETPAFTICLLNSFDSRKINRSRAARKLFTQNRTAAEKDPEVEELLDRPYSEIFDEFGFSTEDAILEHLVYDDLDLINATKFIKRHIYRKRLCFTTANMLYDVQSPSLPKTSYDTVFEILITFSKYRVALAGQHDYFGKGIFLFLRQHGTQLRSERALLVQPGQVTYVLFSRTEYHFLPQPYPSLGDENCIDDVNSNPLKFLPVYTQGNCIYERLQNLSAQECGCVTEEFSEFFEDSNIRECSYREYTGCYAILRDTQASLLSSQCPHACDQSTLQTTMSTMPFEDKHKSDYFHFEDGDDYIHLILQASTTNVETIRHEPEMTLTGIMSTVGGDIGLLLGASLLTVAEWFEFLMTSAKLAFLGWITRR